MVNMKCSKSNTKNGWFRSYLFANKNNSCNQKRNGPCKCGRVTQETKKDEVVQTSGYSDTSEEEKCPVPSVNPMLGKLKEDKKQGGCPGKILPMERRGCGFHFYFCVDNIRKSDLLKRKQTKQIKYGNSKADCNFKPCVDELTSKYNASNNKTGSLTRKVPSSQNIPSANPRRNASITKVNPAGMKGSPEPEKRHNSILRNKQTPSSTSVKDNAPNEVTQSGMKIRFSSTERHIDVQEQETEIKTTKGHKEPTIQKAVDSQEEATVFKEYELLQKNKRKSTVKGRNTLVRNSLMSLRKRQSTARFSFDEVIVSQILSKLNHIEDKITELEKNGEDRGHNIKNIVGISCKSPKSTVSVNRVDKEDQRCEDTSSAATSKANETVVIKVCGDDVVVNGTEIVSITRKKKRDRLESDQLVYRSTPI